MTREAEELSSFIREHPKLVVLSGAGISLDSGIPTYRDDSGKWLPGPPIQERDFLLESQTRQFYWSRSWYGWPRIRDARPNACHNSLATLEARGSVVLTITQNVDGLHQKAGSLKVVDLHGRVDRAYCLDCEAMQCRDAVQEQLGKHNSWPEQVSPGMRPDGDMEISVDDIGAITVPRCPECGGELRPGVVFYGGTVPKQRVQRCNEALEKADALLVVGSSLTVFSGFRFCRRAAELNKGIAVVNPGTTRADELAHTRLRSPAGPLLTETLSLL